MDAETPGGLSLEGIDPGETVIQGRVTRGERAVASAVVQLFDEADELTAEAPTSATGYFRFFSTPGEWTLRAAVPAERAVEVRVSARAGAVSEVTLDLLGLA